MKIMVLTSDDYNDDDDVEVITRMMNYDDEDCNNYDNDYIYDNDNDDNEMNMVMSINL